MGDIVKQMLTRPIQLADQVVKQADDTDYFKQECLGIKGKCEKLVGLLRRFARASSNLYEKPTRRIVDDIEYVLDKALTLIYKCKASGFCCFFTVIPAEEFRKISLQLEYSIGDVSWLLRVSTPADANDVEYLGLPPIAANEPILCLIWEQIAILSGGSVDERSDAAVSLVSLARDNDRYAKLIIEEGGVAPLLKLAKEGKMKGQENASRAIGFLGCDPKCVEEIVNAGVCSVFAKILEEGHMKLQIVVAWAVSELAAHHPKCQDHFAQTNTIRLLVSHIAFETIHEHTVLLANSSKTNNNNNVMEDETTNQMHNQIDGREHEDPATKAEMKAMAARALRFLCAGNVSICKDITESRAILCFSELLETGAENGKYHSAMALIEITLVTKHNPELKPSTFKPFAQVSKAALDQFLAIMNNN
ncbi:hypothetical protein LIER_27458 [Lithospermum erythrorhizon]|uniref:DUF7792 domain-containing protein n=1 Tax=Lithospermum erythrorhizon TaxID=34254 RepID=A0AAV3RI36_LITER